MKLFVATPLYDGRMHLVYMAGMMQALATFTPKEMAAGARQGSFLPCLRDLLTADFIASKADYMLCVDSDIGFTVKDVIALMKHDSDIVSGLYPRKQFLKDEDYVVEYSNPPEDYNILKKADYVGAGFLMVKRQTILAMFEEYKALAYPSNTDHGNVIGIWQPIGPTTDVDGNRRYLAEDFSFCHRWRQMGFGVWVDPNVKLMHAGEHVYR